VAGLQERIVASGPLKEDRSEALDAELAARKHAFLCPGRCPWLPIASSTFPEHRFRQPAVGGDLAAKDIDDLGPSVPSVGAQNVIAGCFLGLGRTVIIERAHARDRSRRYRPWSPAR
jgi:hypothetical protein